MRLAGGWFVLCLFSLATLNSCARPAMKFTGEPTVRVIADDRSIPEPAEIEFRRLRHHANNFFVRQARLRLDPVEAGPARDVNNMGEVPNSSWYENRAAHLSPEDVARGAGADEPGPEAFTPWFITGLKAGGRNPGFVFKDSRGVRYICKFDKLGQPIIATAAGAVAVRLLWACGYHTPDDRVVYFDRPDLQIGDGATYRTAKGKKAPVTPDQIDKLLERFVYHDAEGRYRVLVSRFLPGKPVGGYSYRGTRDDDPNDTIPHDKRRSLRGLRVFAAWLNHVDLKIDNTLDLYTEVDGRHFLRHYLVDFDGCLGGYWAARQEQRIGYAYDVDLREFFTGIFSLGLYKRPYESLESGHREIGLLATDAYEPSQWRANYLNDQLLSSNAADLFWAGTVLSQVSEDHIRAAVTAGRFEDAAAVDQLTHVLLERRARTLDWALTRVTPVIDLDRVQAAGGITVDAGDALVRAGRSVPLQYRSRLLDEDGNVLRDWSDNDGARVSYDGDATGGRRYVVIEWVARNGSHALPPTQGHYMRTESGWRLVGILRDGE